MKAWESKSGLNKVRKKDRKAKALRSQLKFSTDVNCTIRTYTFVQGKCLLLGHFLYQLLNCAMKLRDIPDSPTPTHMIL